MFSSPFIINYLTYYRRARVPVPCHSRRQFSALFIHPFVLRCKFFVLLIMSFILVFLRRSIITYMCVAAITSILFIFLLCCQFPVVFIKSSVLVFVCFFLLCNYYEVFLSIHRLRANLGVYLFILVSLHDRLSAPSTPIYGRLARSRDSLI